MHGTRAIQKIVEILAPLPKHAAQFATFLEGKILVLAHDINGNHVL
jgi:hypothetical protein